MMAWRLLLIVIVLTLAGCDGMSTFAPLFPPKTTTFYDRRFNYEIDYPAGWFVEVADDGTELRTYDPDFVDPQYWESLPPGATQLIIYPLEITEPPTPLAEIITREMEDLPLLSCVVSTPDIYTIDGRRVVVMMTSSDRGDVSTWIYTRSGGRYFKFDVRGSVVSQTVWAIVHSLRPIVPSREGLRRDMFDGIHIEDYYSCQQ
jgi:hypothetical protein